MTLQTVSRIRTGAAGILLLLGALVVAGLGAPAGGRGMANGIVGLFLLAVGIVTLPGRYYLDLRAGRPAHRAG